MTQVVFKTMPMLLTPQQARAVFGCTKETLRALREEHPELGTRLPGMRHWRYRKLMVAKIAGITYE